jgi:dipeptidyl-peptidase-4
MNRHQNHLELLNVDANTGMEKILLEEKNKYFIDIHDNLRFLKDKKQFIWTSEQGGYNHIFLYGLNGKQIKNLTPGSFDVTQFYGLDEEKGVIYYQAAANNPMEREVYSVSINSGISTEMTNEKGTNSAQFSSDYSYYVLNHSTANAAPRYTVYGIKGRKIRTIEDNADMSEMQKSYNVSPVEFFEFKTSEQVSLNAYMIKPPNFNKNKKYPVFMYLYGGPGSQTVTDSWNGSQYWWFQMLAQQGYIVVSVDNRGTGARGEEFRKMTYLQLGKYETMDQIEAAKYLAKQPFIDGNRIGIFGWSYGGYMSSLCILKGNDAFKAAIAVAPVTSWKWYDTIYTERYMRTLEENEAGYKDNSPVYFADRLKGSYLLIHGMADDNVHFQNTVEMTDALIRANKQFDTYFYPNRNHGIYGNNARLHLYTKMTNFIKENI